MINNAGTGRTINVAFNLIVAENFIEACMHSTSAFRFANDWLVRRPGE